MISNEPAKDLRLNAGPPPARSLDTSISSDSQQHSDQDREIEKEREKVAREKELEVVRTSITTTLLPYESRDFIPLLAASILLQGFATPDASFLANKGIALEHIVRNLRDQIDNINQVEELIPIHLEALVEMRLLREDEPGKFYLNPKPSKLPDEAIRNALEETHLFYDVYHRAKDVSFAPLPKDEVPLDKPKEAPIKAQPEKGPDPALQREHAIAQIKRVWRLRENTVESLEECVESVSKAIGYFVDRKAWIVSELAELKRWQDARPQFHAGTNVTGFPEFEAFIDRKLPEIGKKTAARRKALESNPLAFSRRQLFQGGREKSVLAIARTFLGEYERERFDPIKNQVLENLRLLKGSLDFIEKEIKSAERVGSISEVQGVPVKGIIKDLRLPLSGFPSAPDELSSVVLDAVRVFSSFKPEVADSQKAILEGLLKALRYWNAFAGWQDFPLVLEERALIAELIPESKQVRREYLQGVDQALQSLIKEVSYFESHKKAIRTKLELLKREHYQGVNLPDFNLDFLKENQQVLIEFRHSFSEAGRGGLDTDALRFLFTSHSQLCYAFFGVMTVLGAPTCQLRTGEEEAKELLSLVFKWVHGGDETSADGTKDLIGMISDRMQWLLARSPQEVKALRDVVADLTMKVREEIGSI